jgi:hypothetical protein
MVRFDLQAPVCATRGARSLGRVGSPWAALLAAIVVSFRPAVPVIWGDTPSFVESALQTLEAGAPASPGPTRPCAAILA